MRVSSMMFHAAAFDTMRHHLSINPDYLTDYFLLEDELLDQNSYRNLRS